MAFDRLARWSGRNGCGCVLALTLACGAEAASAQGLAAAQGEADRDDSRPSALSLRGGLGGSRLLDDLSVYGKSFFPEPLLNPEMDRVREFRLDWFHSETRGLQYNEVAAEIEFPIGMLTLEAAVPYDNARVVIPNPLGGPAYEDREEGIDSIQLAARHPVYQFVSADRKIDYTVAAALQISVTSNTDVSQDTEILPYAFQLLRLGDHLSIQMDAGLSYLVGPGEGGTQTLDYGATLGYRIDRSQLGIPLIASITPILEINGARGLNRGLNGHDTLLGAVGARIEFDPVEAVHPALELGYIFPLDQGARDQLDWGVLTSLVFRF